MSNLTPEINRRILHILHWGLVEARQLAQSQRHEQLYELADALEMLPEELSSWRPDSLDAVRFNLETYERKHRGQCFEYLKYLDLEQPFPVGHD